jgi:hypothetical protein
MNRAQQLLKAGCLTVVFFLAYLLARGMTAAGYQPERFGD